MLDAIIRKAALREAVDMLTPALLLMKVALEDDKTLSQEGLTDTHARIAHAVALLKTVEEL